MCSGEIFSVPEKELRIQTVVFERQERRVTICRGLLPKKQAAGKPAELAVRPAELAVRPAELAGQQDRDYGQHKNRVRRGAQPYPTAVQGNIPAQ
jgi:hypothetical protein